MIDQDDVSLAGVLQGAVAAELVAQSDTPVFAGVVVGRTDNTRLSET